jgi:hypothetical protein
MTPAEWEARIMPVVDELGLLFAHAPDEKVAASLEQMRKNLNVEFCALFPSAPPETLAAGVDSILAEIQKRRREIEAAGEMPRAMKN